MMNLVNLLIFGYLAVSGVILSYVVIVTDKKRKMVKREQPSRSTVLVFPGSIMVLCVLYLLRLGVMAGAGVFSGVGFTVLVGVLIALIPVFFIGFVIWESKRVGGT